MQTGFHPDQAFGPGRHVQELYGRGDGMEHQAKRHQPMQMQLPAPLTDALMSVVMGELNQGTARAVESCLQCYRAKRMSGEDLTSFIRSIAMHSRTLADLFAKQQEQVFEGEVACADDLAELMAMSGLPVPAPAIAPAPVQRLVAPSAHVSAPPSQHAATPMPAISVERAPATKLVVQRTRKAKVSSPSDEELRLMQWWSEKRVTEISRRQHETAQCHQLPTSAEKNGAYVRFLMGKLMTTLPTAGNLRLLEHVRAFNLNGDIATFSTRVKDLVDQYDVKISLAYPPECTVRPATRKQQAAAAAAAAAAVPNAVPSIDFDGDEISEDAECSWPAVDSMVPKEVSAAAHSHCHSACAHDSAALGKRKRTETLNGAHPEDEDDMAACPVCKEEPREDDRWVKCDGCGSWYHQICVLFNEIAHGKSVRFFCRTPGCRKRGSRQLNRRQRKPCYPTSPSIESSVLADRMTEMVAPVARADRHVVIKMVANAETLRDVKGVRAGRKSQERVRSKTICAFQHTLIGSDLLFFVMFVEEIVGSDGVGRVELQHIDSNGFYEELDIREALEVEKAIIQSYLSCAASIGFATARIHVGGTKRRSLFLGAPTNMACATASVAACMDLMNSAHCHNIVDAYQLERPEASSREVVRAQLNASVRQVMAERDADIACPLAQSCEDWLTVQEQNSYKFDDVQYAKFSSMMLVYHLIKGWKKEFTAPPRPTAAPCSRIQPEPASPLPASSAESSPSMNATEAQVCAPPMPAQAIYRMPWQGSAYEPMDLSEGELRTMAASASNVSLSEMVRNSSSERRIMKTSTSNESLNELVGSSSVSYNHYDRHRGLDLSQSSLEHLPKEVRQMLQMETSTVVPPMRRPMYTNDNPAPPPPVIQHQQSPSLASTAASVEVSNDDFWADQVLFGGAEEEKTEESPFWDCFFNTL